MLAVEQNKTKHIYSFFVSVSKQSFIMSMSVSLSISDVWWNVMSRAIFRPSLKQN